MPEHAIDNTPQDATHRDVVCPFCSLLCDDLVVRSREGKTQVLQNACPRGSAGFARMPLSVTPTIAGKPVALEQAARRAAQMLARSKRPLIGGLGTDVDGVREALALAERCGGIVDHMYGNAMASNLRVLQTRGWITTTLSELRNRADLIVLVGVNLSDRYQQFFRRYIEPAATLDSARREDRRVVYLGPQVGAPRADTVPVETIACAPGQLDATIGALRAAVSGQPFHLRGAQQKKIVALAAALRLARYPVFVWAPAQLDRHNGDITIGQVCGLVDTLNVEGRAAGLFLGGDDGGQSAISASTWITGFPLRLSYAGQAIDYDPLNLRTDRLLAENAVDTLLWISSFGPAAPPPAGKPVPVIAVGWPPEESPAVHIPTGTPGVDHAGRLLRTDTVVSLHLKPVRQTVLPSVAEVLHAIAAAL